ncbi:hypothetical protein XELAEV_18002895mg [Xenopus laevis]|nr:hypothetical protein XELAEV_18002895mg [Xenopus laevis]
MTSGRAQRKRHRNSRERQGALKGNVTAIVGNLPLLFCLIRLLFNPPLLRENAVNEAERQSDSMYCGR